MRIIYISYIGATLEVVLIWIFYFILKVQIYLRGFTHAKGVTQDANNHVFVIVFGVAKAKNIDNWRIVKEVMPNNTFYRNCVLHMRKNCELRFRDKQVKRCVWEVARSTTLIQFKDTIDKLKIVSLGTWEYISKFDPKVWCRIFFSHYSKNAIMTNNMCEAWNAVIVEARKKLILTLCEELRIHIMKKNDYSQKAFRGLQGTAGISATNKIG
ncbi:hypothetical protein Ahy_B01g056414 [Arachis hypogaea]|uniref:Uncharacterized protein n=1 Tax=Arachis hypogaea TaxID=3818 RepID=A0A445AYU1_ARAHY|nr:hypothetical protein Ahy_B01g056414 [Arachis hypogaea]